MNGDYLRDILIKVRLTSPREDENPQGFTE